MCHSAILTYHLAEQLHAEEYREYHLFERNCQSFVTDLASRIPRTELTATMIDQASIKLAERTAGSFRKLLETLSLAPEAVVSNAPEQIRDFIARMKHWLLRFLCQWGPLLASYVAWLLPDLLSNIYSGLCTAGSMLVHAAQALPGITYALLQTLVNAGLTIWVSVSHPIVVSVLFGGLAVTAVIQGGRWVWKWFCSNKDILNRIKCIELV